MRGPHSEHHGCRVVSPSLPQPHLQLIALESYESWLVAQLALGEKEMTHKLKKIFSTSLLM